MYLCTCQVVNGHKVIFDIICTLFYTFCNKGDDKISSVKNGFTESLEAEKGYCISHETGLGAVKTGSSRYRT